MKTTVYYSMLGFMVFLTTACTVENNYYNDEPDTNHTAGVLKDYEIWYLDYNRTTGSGEVPFMARAFTLSFDEGNHGVLYANNNIAGIGFTGEGYGIPVGDYDLGNKTVSIHHDIDGTYIFDVIYDGNNRIRLYNATENVTYYLFGYDRDEFDYDRLYYDNIEYLLQEFALWRKTYTSDEGYVNEFDRENFLSFTPEAGFTFYSSLDNSYAYPDEIQWDYNGSYYVEDIEGYDDLKVLVLDYQGGAQESFELQITSDSEMYLYHYDSGTTYRFNAEGFIQYKQSGGGIKRKIIKRKTVKRPLHIENIPKKNSFHK